MKLTYLLISLINYMAHATVLYKRSNHIDSGVDVCHGVTCPPGTVTCEITILKEGLDTISVIQCLDEQNDVILEKRHQKDRNITSISSTSNTRFQYKSGPLDLTHAGLSGDSGIPFFVTYEYLVKEDLEKARLLQEKIIAQQEAVAEKMTIAKNHHASKMREMKDKHQANMDKHKKKHSSL